MKIAITLKFLPVFGAFLALGKLYAQPKLDFEIKKPKEFEERQLGSEKNADKKFTLVRRFFQNTYTHYNYYFNANNMINDILDNSAMSHVDDYTELLTYYPWQLEQTKQSRDIDSILKTATAGILLHDLRNDWIDNMYLLIGKAYFLRKDFDSAAMTFQYLNYSFANKDKDGYDLPIGSNSEEGSNAFAILSKERNSYLLKRPPSRNDAFVWKIRNDIERGNFIDASSLIAIVRNDPNFPKRLQPDLDEVIGYLFYKIQLWDSAAHYLESAMPMAKNASDKARRWFLTGQLYQLGNNPQKASEAYSKTLGLATDLVMELYARLNSIRLRKNENPAVIDQNIRDLLAMAKRDKYAEYRDIIYYATALVELEREGFDAADEYLNKSVKNSTNNSKQKSISWLAMGDLRFQQKNYGPAGPPYDSLELQSLKTDEAKRVEERKPPTLKIFQAERTISLQDSLIALADLPETERNQKVKKLSSQLRKNMGLKEESIDIGSESVSRKGSDNTSTELFAPTSGTWYFYESTIRSKGFNTFKERWGARPNSDNWRRSSALMVANNTPLPKNESETGGDPDGFALTEIKKTEEDLFDSTDVSFDNLYSRIPLTPERRLAAEEKIVDALFVKAKALHEEIEDYPEAIKVYEEILRRRDTGKIAEQTLFALIHCYSKVGEIAKANQARNMLEKMNPDMVVKKENQPSRKLLDETYDKIYGLFLEGQFSQALEEKRKADSLLGNSYWKPQLLYIQSVYHIKQREDSLAIQELNNIINTFPEHKLTAKSKRVIDVLKRRSEIEDYLSKLEITRVQDDDLMVTTSKPVITELPRVEKWSAEDSARLSETTLLAQKQAAEAAKADAERLAREEADKMAKADADRAAKAEEERLAREEAEKAAKAEAARLAKQESERAAKAEAERIAREEAEKAAKAEAEKLAREDAEKAEKAEADRIAAEKALAEKQAEEKLKAEQELAARLTAEKEKAEKELAEKQAEERARAERELAEKQAREKEALEKEATNKAEAERLLAEKQAKEKEALEKELAEKLAAEKAQAEKDAAEKAAAERTAAEKALAEKQATEKAEAERNAIEKAEADKKEKERRHEEAKATEARLAREKQEREAVEKLEAEKLAKQRKDAEEAAERIAKENAAKEVAEKKEAEILAKQKKEAQETAERLAKEKAEKEAADKAALAKLQMVDNVVVGTPTTPSPYKINANEKQVIAIVLERVDPAYVNEVSYSLTHSSFKNMDKNEVEVTKKKIRDNLWFVEMRSPGFVNMQAAYEYIKYIKPITRDELVTWLDESKYYFITLNEGSLKEIEKSGDVKLYYQVLKEAIPGKF